MSKKENQENLLISSMMEHLEIKQPSPGFTHGVMDRINLEPDLAMKQVKPLISRTGLIIISVIIGLTIIVLFAMMSSNPALQAGEFTQPVINFPDLGTFFGSARVWLNESRGLLTWFTLSLFSLFILSAIDYLLKHLKIRHGFVL